jgi:hypothetical protein
MSKALSRMGRHAVIGNIPRYRIFSIQQPEHRAGLSDLPNLVQQTRTN